MTKIGDVLLLGFVAEGGDDFATAGGFLIEQGYVEIAIDRHGQRARDRRGGHHENIGKRALPDEGGALCDAELVLLVDHHESEIREEGFIVKQGVGADENRRAVCGDGFLALVRRAENEVHAERLQPFPEGEEMLLGEDLGGGHQRGIGSGIDGE